MPKYNFKAVDLNNKKVKGTFIANDDEDLKKIIAHQGYYLVSYRKQPESTQMFGFLEKIKLSDFTMFCRQFEIMLNAGLSVDSTVLFLSKTSKNKKLKDTLEVVYNDVMKGKMLSDAFSRFPKTFPTFFRNMVAIGEESGSLEGIFSRLADYYESEQATKKKVKQALAYPIFLVTLAVIAITVIAVFVIPKFEAIFSQFGSELPTITRVVLDVSNFVRENILTILFALFVFIGLILLLKRNKKFRKGMDWFKLNAPLLKKINVAVVTSRFATSLSTLLASGIPIIKSIEIVARLINNQIVEEKLIVVKNEIQSGGPIAKSLNTVNLFPSMLVEMVSVGEQTSQLEQVLARTNKYFEDQVDTEIRAVTKSIEPVLLMVIAGIVVVILLSIFLPMMDLMTAIESSV